MRNGQVAQNDCEPSSNAPGTDVFFIKCCLSSGGNDMRRRLRKKKRLGEFRELGFDVSYLPVAGTTESDNERFLDAFIESAVEANGLACSGGGFPGRTMEFFVTRSGLRPSTTEGDRRLVHAWLEARPDVASFTVGGLRDAWYGHD